MICFLIQNVGTHSMVKQRAVKHMLLDGQQSRSKPLSNDIICTLNIDPANLGIDQEADGRIFAGTAVRLRARDVNNQLDFAQATKDRRCPSPREPRPDPRSRSLFTVKGLRTNAAIPFKILDIEIRNTILRCVAVVEHRNLGTLVNLCFDSQLRHCRLP